MNKSEIILYQTKNCDISIDVLIENDTVWLTQSQMGMLFEKSRPTISEHIKNVFSEGELDEKVSCRKFRHDTSLGAIEGKMKTSYTNLYNLDVIISVGYRIKSKRGTEFRIWANKVLKDYIIKGYAINDRLKIEQYSLNCDFNMINLIFMIMKSQNNLINHSKSNKSQESKFRQKIKTIKNKQL